ncbi:MFS transporter [Armatimonas rosea]|uniref:MFS family permease n=1 Tax=Armatimonas rosea TaxID=685828 RepID=A0A7W9W926_ARMRO|nr:MFS transporter [Armatimonas rosea]MBB6053388.1 MFS family permease [Armatimonas rosea]
MDPERPLPATVKALGLVSLLTDLSSEMVYPLNGRLLRLLGAPAWALGLIEGLAEATASTLKLYSGTVSDRMGRRKPLALLGYGLAALSKPLIGVAGGWPLVLGARLLDRTGKGLRGAPRDALIADICPKEQRGRAYGLHRSLDTTGAVLGPLVGYWYLRTHPESLRTLYWLAFIPAVLGVLLLWLVVKEQPRREAANKTVPRFSLSGISPTYQRFLLAVGIFSLSNSSDQFLLLRAQEGAGLSPQNILLVYALFNVVEASLGYIVGKRSDKIGRVPLILAGWGVFALVYAGFALLPGGLGFSGVLGLFLLYGLYYTLTQGAQKALAADLSDPNARGQQLGVFHLVVGLGALPASLLAGLLYERVSPSAPFWVGAGGALVAMLLLPREKKS